MAKEKLTIIIDGDAKGAVNASKQAQGSISKLGKLIGGLALGAGALMLASKGFDILSKSIKGMTRFIGDSISVAADFEKAMRNVNSIMGQSEEEFTKTSEAVTKMAAEFPQSSQVLAEGLYDIASSGFAGADGLTVLEASARAASAGLTDTKTAAAGITAVLNAYGLSAEDAGEVSDIMFTTVKKGVTTFEKLSSNLGVILSTAKTAKVSFAQLSGALAYMTTKGISTEEAVTSLNQIILAFIDPSIEMAEALEEAGYQSGETMLAEEGLAGALETLSDAAGGSITKLNDMLGNVRALKGGAALLGSGFEDLEKFMADFNETSGATADAFAEQSKSYAFQLDILKTRFGDVKKTIGDAFLPVLTETISRITESGGMFDNFAAGIENIAGRISEIINEITTGEDYADLTFGEKILKVWDDTILPGIQTKVDAIWAKFGIWIDENKDTIYGWGENIGEVLSRAITAVLGTASLDMESEESLSNAEEFGKAFGTGIVKGIKEVFTLKNIWELIMGQLGFEDRPTGGLENSIENQIEIFEKPFGGALDKIGEVKDEIDTTFSPKEAEILIKDNAQEALGRLGIIDSYRIQDKTFNILPNSSYMAGAMGQAGTSYPYTGVMAAIAGISHDTSVWETTIAGMRQSGGELRRDSYIPDLGVQGIKGEGYIPEPLMRAIKQGRGSYAGVDAGGGGSITNNFNISELVVREEADIHKISQTLHTMQLQEQRGGGYR